LHGKYAGRFSARRGELRIIYAVNEAARAVEVSDVDYRRDVYH
jgi:mRNA-degrading endonuclease RelE of RelBE toxin-antitoxin system